MVSIRTGPCCPPDAMEDPGAAARGLEDHLGAVVQLSGGDLGAVAATPEPGGGLFKAGEEVCGAPEARLFTRGEGVDFAVGLVDPVDAFSSSREERMPEAGEAKASNSEEMPMIMEEENGGSLLFVAQGSAEPGSLRTCHVSNGGLSDREIHALSSETSCFKDFGCVCGTSDKVKEGSPRGRVDLVGNGRVAEVKTCMMYTDMASEGTNRCNVGSLDSVKPCSEQWHDGVDGLGRIADDNNEPQQNDLVPNIGADVLHADSDFSVSGSIGVSVDGKAVQFLQKSDNPVTSRVADGGLCDNNCFSGPAGCMYGMVGMATEGNPREENSLAGESVLGGGVDAKTSLHNLEMHCKVPYYNYKGSPDLVKLGIERLPYGMAATCLKRSADPNLEKYGFLPKVAAEDSMIMHKDSVSSVPGISVTVSVDGMPGHIGDSTEHKAIMENVAFGSEGGGTLSLGSQFSRREVNTSEEDMGTGWAEAPHDMGGISDLGEHHTEELPSGTDGLTLVTGANHEMEIVLPNIDPVGSCPIDEGSVLSIYHGSSVNVRLDRKRDLIGCVSERSSDVDKPACSSQEGDMLLCESSLHSKAYGYKKNQESSMEAFNRLNVSLCKSSMEELKSCVPSSENGIQQIPQKYGIRDSPSERDLHSSYKLQQQCDEEPSFSGREPPAPCVGPQVSGVGGSGCVDFNACNSAYDKAGSVDFVSNGNDTKSQSQQLSPVLVFRRRNPKRAASSRNLCSERSDQINKVSSGSSRPKRVELAKSLYQRTTHMFPNKITRGRSDLNRQHKASVWGNLEKLMDDFSQSHGPLTPNSRPTSLENGRSSKRSDRINLSNIRKCRSSRSSKSRCSKLSDIGHSTNELKGRSAFSAIADSDASLECRREVIPKVASYTSEFTDSTKSHHLKRDFASSTQEICAVEIHGECAKISTSESPLKNDNGTVMLPIGFSPDSVLEIASITGESNAPANHDVIPRENPLAGVLNEGGHHSVVLPTSYLGKNQAPSLMQLEQHAITAGVSENMKRVQTDPPHTMMNNDAGIGDVQTSQKSKTVRKNNVVRKKGSNKKEGSTRIKLKSRSSTQISSCEASKPMTFSKDATLPDPSELLVHTGYPELDSCFEAQTSALQDHGNAKSHLVTDNSKGSAFHTKKSPKHKQKNTNEGKKGKVRDTHTQGKDKKKNIADGTSLDCGSLNLHSTLLATSQMKEQSDLSPATEHAFKNSGTTFSDLPGNILCKIDDASVSAAAPPPPPRAAWVCCDDCQKWRCIPAELADVIGETNCRWTCKDNRDKTFADCSIPQEKSNAEINAELDLSDVSADEADGDASNSKACRAPSWTPVRLNLFLHRTRRTQSIDESMVCNCKPPEDGRMGCGDGCLNRMLNIECVKRTCPCGEQCSNQQFQRRNYAKLRWLHSGKKGFGLQLQEDVSEGRFLIEYVGEVLDIASYESRQQYYASKGQKHFYFMALNGGEVIDACTKGNLGRFINHSCSPNCRTEKWMVNGEVCIGIFAVRNIKKGEELTFDYNYVRVSGAAPQKCFCGTARCRGYIGGDISIVDTINQDDTEAGHFEHTVHKDSEELMGANVSGSHGSHPDITGSEFSTQDEDLHDFPAANSELEPLKQTGGTMLDPSEPENSLDAWYSQEDEDVVRTPVHVSRTVESSLQHFPVHAIQSSDCLRQTPCTSEIVKDPDVVDGPPPGFGGNLVPGSNANRRNNLKHHKNVKRSPPIDNEHILGVERRLTNLLDRDGGISKRKDATNGYLKLLVLTAAEGDSSGGTSKSVRDLSLILDALLKTKSRAVLLDIINKNGLQMLHNILKQNRSNFHRTPIIRKLLKVLEYLALKEILTYEHINEGPRRDGVESFRDSMLNLTRHNDSKVHQIARNFRNRWIPRNIARCETTEFPRASTSAQDFRGNIVWNSTRRKRKSRWDYQPDEHYKMVGLKFQKAYHEHGSFDVIGLMGNKMQGYQGANKYQNDVHGIVNSTESATDEVPPGFESHQECQPVQAIDCKVAPGLCMGRYQPSLTISYGIPIALVQHIGTPEVEGQCHQKWKVAPGVPFNPFPPLPPYPRGSPCASTSSHVSQNDGSPNMKHSSSGQGHYGRTTTDRDGRVHRTWRNGPRTRWPYSNHGRRFPSNHQRSE